MNPFREASSAPAQKAGATTIAFAAPSQVEVFEGSWDLPCLLLIEKYTSMKALKDFWYSKKYKETKKLRERLVNVNFIVALEEAE